MVIFFVHGGLFVGYQWHWTMIFFSSAFWLWHYPDVVREEN